MKATIKFHKDSFYFKQGEVERIVNNLTEVHYNYPSPIAPQVAFESDIDATGFTVKISDIQEIEITNH